MKVTKEPTFSSLEMQLDQSGITAFVSPVDGPAGAGPGPGQSNGNGVRMSE